MIICAGGILKCLFVFCFLFLFGRLHFAHKLILVAIFFENVNETLKYLSRLVIIFVKVFITPCDHFRCLEDQPSGHNHYASVQSTLREEICYPDLGVLFPGLIARAKVKPERET